MEDGPLHSIHWFRIVLDEAHTIKAFRTSTSKAVFMLTADRRWCLTGTPIQVNSASLLYVKHLGFMSIDVSVFEALFPCTLVFIFIYATFDFFGS